MKTLLAIVAVLQLLIADSAPGATYLLAWPLLSAVLSFALLMSAPPRIGIGWRLGALLLFPAPVFVLLRPLISDLIVALGLRGASPIIAVTVLLMLICVSPQLVLIARRS